MEVILQNHGRRMKGQVRVFTLDGARQKIAKYFLVKIGQFLFALP